MPWRTFLAWHDYRARQHREENVRAGNARRRREFEGGLEEFRRSVGGGG